MGQSQGFTRPLKSCLKTIDKEKSAVTSSASKKSVFFVPKVLVRPYKLLDKERREKRQAAHTNFPYKILNNRLVRVPFPDVFLQEDLDDPKEPTNHATHYNATDMMPEYSVPLSTKTLHSFAISPSATFQSSLKFKIKRKLLAEDDEQSQTNFKKSHLYSTS